MEIVECIVSFNRHHVNLIFPHVVIVKSLQNHEWLKNTKNICVNFILIIVIGLYYFCSTIPMVQVHWLKCVSNQCS